MQDGTVLAFTESCKTAGKRDWRQWEEGRWGVWHAEGRPGMTQYHRGPSLVGFIAPSAAGLRVLGLDNLSWYNVC